MKKPIALSALLVFAVLVATALWYWQSNSSSVDPDRLTLYGNVDIRQVSLAFNATERIVALHAIEGDRVRKGDLLGELDQRVLRLHLAQTAAQIGAQEQVVLRLRNGSRPEEIAQARANLAAADAERELAMRQLERLNAASVATAGGAVSVQDLDTARAHAQVTEAQAASLRNLAQLVIAGPRAEDIAQAQKQLAALQSERALIERQLAESELRAPVDAEVRARLLEVGDMASAQRPVFTLASTEPKWVRAYVPEGVLGRIHLGTTAQVHSDSAPQQPIKATVGYIGSVAEFTPKTVQTPELRTSLVYEVRFLIEDPDNRMRLGMPATVQLRLDPLAGGAGQGQ